MRIAIADANIFIDLIYIELHAKLFELDLELHTTLYVYEELNIEQQNALSKFIKKSNLTIHTQEEFESIQKVEIRKGLSESDISILLMAAELDAILLTGDNLLRKVSTLQKIEVHGIFWLMDNFLKERLITKRKATQCLKSLMDYNKRLPQEECDKRLAEWR